MAPKAFIVLPTHRPTFFPHQFLKWNALNTKVSIALLSFVMPFSSSQNASSYLLPTYPLKEKTA